MLRATAAALCCVLTAAHAAAPLVASSTPSQVMSSIRERGGRDVLWTLWEQDKTFDALLTHVDRGETQWFDIWVELRKYSDAGASESIDMAFARAIQKAPTQVLRLIGKGLSLEGVCTSPFIEPAPGVAEHYERKALRALRRVNAADLKVLANACAARVRLPKVRGA